METVKVQRWSSAIDVSFWHTLKTLKLDEYKLDAREQPINGFYSPPNHISNPSLLSLDASAYNKQLTFSPGSNQLPAVGTLLNFNTMQDFTACDYNAVLNQSGTALWRDIKSGAAVHVRFLSLFLLGPCS
eukprot:TRINITY_DN10684_c0_g1_i3.p1 TRINITY_DN10684_c0_g1~~TRINITY_DN10684_c0_g1_i3.p1  ORF type:complete len:130 (-),score=38.64 TRINITY_DN10684_c0_g1_i3:42-431(-)